MRLLVTGGLGFIGSNFVRRAISADEETTIINADMMTYGSNKENLAGVDRSARYRFVKVDVADVATMKKLVGTCDAVINLAAETHVDRSISSGASFLRSNVYGVFSILEALRSARRKVPFVQVGTDEEYGDIDEGSYREGDPLSPSSPYAATKASASLLALAYVRTYGVDARIGRCTNNYGPYQFPEKLIPKSIIRTKLGLKVPLYGNGKNVRDWIHVDDHCDAIRAILEKGSEGGVYNVAGGNEVENLELVKTILKSMGKDESMIEFVEDRPGHDARYSLDDRKARKELGWRPKRSFREGVAGTVRWYAENEAWWRPLADEKTLSPAPWKLRW